MNREQVGNLIYGDTGQRQRFTQDFPVLPDVWMAYGENPADRVELLLTPHTRSDAPTLARALRERMDAEQQVAEPTGAIPRKIDIARQETDVLFNESVVYARLSFAELIRVAMPLTDWWGRVIAPIVSDWSRESLLNFGLSPLEPDPHSKGDIKLFKQLISLVGSIEYDRLHHSEQAPTFQEQLHAFADLVSGLTNPKEKRGLLWASVKTVRQVQAFGDPGTRSRQTRQPACFKWIRAGFAGPFSTRA